MKYELLIQNGKKIYSPMVEGKITWETQREDAPGKLTFNVLKDDVLKIENGNAVSFIIDGAKVFFGFIFVIEESEDHILSITAYDQLRYFKNKATYAYTKKKYSDLVKMIAKDFGLKTGSIQDTGYTIAKKVEEDKTLFDIVGNASDETVLHGNKMFVLYDDFGKITLKNIEKMKLPMSLTVGMMQSKGYSYKKDIDTNTYNQVRLTRKNATTGKKDVYIAKHSKNINKWGLLQYTENLDEKSKTDIKEKALNLLNFYNKETKALCIKDQTGDVRARAGCGVMTYLELTNETIKQYLLIEKATHTFDGNSHRMDLTMRGDL